MTPTQLANVIQGRFATQVAAPRRLPTIYDNDPTPAPADGSLWCRFTVLDGDTRRITVGVKQYRTVGVAIAQLFGPAGEGTRAQRDTAGAIVSAFQDQAADGVRYGVPAVTNIGKTSQGNYQINVTCPFQAETAQT
jgi:hypothetical protein